MASDAHGGGIWSAGVGTLTLRNCTVSGNRSAVVPPNGRFAIGGGVHIQDGGGLAITNSVVAGNTASLRSLLPGGLEMIANGGGIHVGDDSDVTIDNTRIDGNTVVVDDPAGQPAGFDAGMIVGVSTLTLRNSTVNDNRVIANVAATDDNGSSGSALEFDGVATIENTRIAGNSTVVTSAAGNAAAVGAISAFGAGADVRDQQHRDRGQHGQRIDHDRRRHRPGRGPPEQRTARAAERARHPERCDSQWAGRVRAGGRHLERRRSSTRPRCSSRSSTPASSRTRSRRTPGLTVAGAGLFTQFPVTAHQQPDRAERLRTTAPVAEGSERSRANAVALTRAALSRGSELEKRPAYEVLLTTLWGCSRGG